MGFCHYGQMMLDPGAEVIASLEKGDEIVLKAGYGYPKSNQDRTLVVMEVADYSALCANGTLLACADGSFVTKTERKVKVKPSLKARKIQLEVVQRKIGRWLEDSWSNFEAEVWLFSLKFRKSPRSNKN